MEVGSKGRLRPPRWPGNFTVWPKVAQRGLGVFRSCNYHLVCHQFGKYVGILVKGQVPKTENFVRTLKQLLGM